MMIVRSIDMLSCGKMLGTLYALIGFILGAIFTLIALIGVAVTAPDAGGVGPVVFGVGAIIAMPVFYGLAGFIGGIIVSALYNLVASLVGGIEIKIQRSQQSSELQ